MKIAFIGSGKVATALGLYFKNKGFEIQGYFSRNPESAKKAAELTGSNAYLSLHNLITDSQQIWITTPDDQIERVAQQISSLDIPQKNDKIFLHASGALSVSALNSLKESGYNMACAHPLLAFGEPNVAEKSLHSVWFAVEDTENENFSLRDFFASCGNSVLNIPADKKPLYHAAACVLSNYLVTLMNASYQIFEKSGVAKQDVQKATMPLLESVVDNLKGKNCTDALTGPIKRGDENTVNLHIESLNKFAPEMTELYTFMAKETRKMLKGEVKK